MEYTLDTPKLDWKKEATRTLSNKITLARICATPFFLALLVLSGLSWSFRPLSIGLKIGTAVFALAIWVSDGADGYIARKRNEVTLFGSVFDPAADKIFILPSLLILVFSVLRKWLVLVFFVLFLVFIEAVLSCIGIWGYRRAQAEQISGRMVGANIFGKAKLNIESILVFELVADHMGIGLHLVSAPFAFWLSFTLITLSTILACLSVLGHIVDMLGFLHTEQVEP